MTARKSKSEPVGSSAQAVCQALERRMLLSLSPAGTEFHVNTYTTLSQFRPAIAADGDGDFVVVWESNQEGTGGGSGIYAQRYDGPSGAALGGEIHVNTLTSGAQENPAIAMDADGDFVIVWSSTAVPNGGVRGQRFNGAGVPQGAEFSINSSGSNPTVAMDVAGNFAVAFQAFLGGGLGVDVYVRRYDFLGAAQGDPVRVNTHLPSSQHEPTVAMDASGDFVVAWQSYLQDGSEYGVYAQRFNAAGAAQGAEFRVNTFTTGTQRVPSVAMDLSGDFVVAWYTYAHTGDPDGIYAQRYDASGVAQGTEFRANTFTTGGQFYPSVAMDADGDFLIAWESPQDGSSSGVYAQQFLASGAMVGSEFRVNTFTIGGQYGPAVAADHKGDYVVTWTDSGQEGVGFGSGIYAQRFEESTDTAGPIIAGVFVNSINSSRVLPYSTHDATMQQIAVSFSEYMTETGLNDVKNPANWLLTRNGTDITSDISSIDFFVTGGVANRFHAVLNLTTAYTSGNFLVQARDTMHDGTGVALDGNFDGAPGGSFPLPFSLGFGARGAEFRVSTFTTSSHGEPSVAVDADGDFVVAWQNYGQDGARWGIHAQRYNAAGVAEGAEFRVNTFTTGDQEYPSVAMDDNGDFVVVWQSIQDGSDRGVYAQRYNATGVAQGAEFRVNTFTTSFQGYPSVAMDNAGNFVVAWSSYGQDGDAGGIYARQYNAAGVAQGGEFRVNTTTVAHATLPSVAMDADGDFVIAWELRGTTVYSVFLQRYNAAGVAQGGEHLLSSVNNEFRPSVAIDADGDFVVAWERFVSSLGIFAQRFNAAGVPQGSVFLVNTYTTDAQGAPSVSMDANGDFVVAWESSGQDGSGNGVFAQRYNAAGVAQGIEFRVNSYTTNNQRFPSVAMDDDGDFVVAWEGFGQEGFHIHARRYGTLATPTVGLLVDIPDPVQSGGTLTLTASNVTDDGIVTSVSFYRESNGVAGLQVGAEGDTLVAIDLTPTGGIWSADISTSGLGGTYTYWAQATDDADLIGTPASTTNTVTEAAPAVTATDFLFNTLPQRITFTFSVNVGASLSLADFVVQNLSVGQTVTPDSLSYDTGTNTATLSFNTPLADGNYRATALAAGITNSSGVPLPADVMFEFFFLLGDANHDGRVNLNDFNIVAANFGQSNRNFSQGDFNYDTVVNLLDFNLLASRFGQVLAPAQFGREPIGLSDDDLRDLTQ